MPTHTPSIRNLAAALIAILVVAWCISNQDTHSAFAGSSFNPPVFPPAQGTQGIPVHSVSPQPTTPVPRAGSYRVLGHPTISVARINAILAAYHSPAAGLGQALYDYGVKYGIDPIYALAFFLHESTMGTTGVARTTLSLGNLRCIPDRPCVPTGVNGYFAQMYSWEDGFEQWYKLIRNLYVKQKGLVTIDQIIPVYAPSSDHNDVKGYIAALKEYIDAWHAGAIRV